MFRPIGKRSSAIGASVLDWLALAPDAPAINFAGLVGAAALVGLLTTRAGVLAVLSPLAAPPADSWNLSIEAVLMTQRVGVAATLLSYQSAAVVWRCNCGRPFPLRSGSACSAPSCWWRRLGHLS